MKTEISPDQQQSRSTAKGLANLFVVYIVWSSTYLAIRLAVREGAGFPPFLMGASRLLTASLILVSIAFLFRLSLKISKSDLFVLGLSGIMLWVGGNGMVNWSEQHTPSGYAALIVGSTPLFVCLMEAIIDRKRPARLLIMSILVGFAGLAVLVWPSFRGGFHTDWLSAIALCFGAISWGAGSLYTNRRPLHISSFATSFYQQLFGGLGYLIVGLLAREPMPHPSHQAWLAWGYLIIFGSLLAYTSFVVALRNLPVSIVMTYGYVNPVLAVILGWMILDESLTWWTACGTALILVGIAGVFRQKYIKKEKTEKIQIAE